MSSFSSIPFRTKASNDGFYPLINRDADGIPSLTLEIMVYGYNNYKALQNKIARGTPKVPSGTTVVNWHSNAGGAKGTLVVPIYQGQTEEYQAVLVSFAPEGLGRDAVGEEAIFRGTLKFIILSDVTP